MAGRIRDEDVQEVKERTSLDEIVREHVTLRPAGVGSLKGLCPFHEEKTPSFTVRPAVGAWHCFGCGQGGDAIAFVMKIDHLSFAESVERLAGKLGMELRYDETPGRGGGSGAEGGGLGRRARLVEAHRVAAEFYHRSLVEAAGPHHTDARTGRDFLRAKGFDGAAAARFQVGYAPRSGEALARHLRERGFTDDELVVAGLAGRGGRGLYDRFRGRLVWPIRDITGDPVGFGARRLHDDDRIAAKYLNTSDTPIYRKTSVLYGLDLAKKALAETRHAVVVEGYTDVMACHLAGVDTAVATCGTAFGADHIKTLRRILRDEPGLSPARVVFTFDGDAAGQKAAMAAYKLDQRWASQCFVAVAPAGQDPNDLRLRSGDAAVRALVDNAVPMFEFAVRTTVAPYDLDRAEERVQAMRAAAPIIAAIRDTALRPEYVRTVAGWLGVPTEELAAQVRRTAQAPAREPVSHTTQVDRPADSDEERPPPLPAPDLRDPAVNAERQLLQVLLQYPHTVEPGPLDDLPLQALVAPAHRAVMHGIRQAGGMAAAGGMSAAGWAGAVAQQTPPAARPLVHELAVAPLPERLDPASGLPPQRYVDSLVAGVTDRVLARRIADAMSALQRAEPGSAEARRINEELTGLQRERVRRRAEVS